MPESGLGHDAARHADDAAGLDVTATAPPDEELSPVAPLVQPEIAEDDGGWRDEVPVAGTIELAPDPRALDGLGRNHSLETALADLVDNSIDAGASHVLIRFVRREGRMRALYVVDNGKGMSPAGIDTAMTVGGRREYNSGDLGRFGIGLKAASFSQAVSLTVLSKAAGYSAVGRRWRVDPQRRGFHCDVVPAAFADAELARGWGIPRYKTGTVVRWDDVTGFPATDDPERIESFVTRTNTAVLNHLGLVFHRLIEDDRVQIGVGVEDVDSGYPATGFKVVAINPFGYAKTGMRGFPKELTANSGDAEIRFTCHIWPGRSNMPEFRLPGGPIERQGLYFYRRDRLLQAGGGWDGIHASDRRLQLARVAIEIDDDIARLFRMNPEKSRVLVGPEFARLAEIARAEDATTFADYLEISEQAFRQSRQRSRNRRKMFPPGKGFTPLVRRTIEDEIPLYESDLAIDVRWRSLESEDFFAVDRERQTLWLNERYRKAILGGRRGGLNDVPVIKSLLYLLAEDLFQGEYLGPKDKDNIELWQEILTAAAKSERL